MSTLIEENNETFILYIPKTREDVETIYTPLYFATIELSESGNDGFMHGGGEGIYADRNKLTTPFRYFVQLIEGDVVSDSHWHFPDFSQLISGLWKKDAPASSEPEPSSSTSSSFSNTTNNETSAESDKESGSFSMFGSKETETSTTQPATEHVEGEQEQPPTTEPVTEHVEGEQEQPVEEPVTPATPPPENSMSLKFKLEPNIENNGKPLSEILETLKQKERTIEDSLASGINYLLFESIINDLRSQNEYLNEHLKMGYTRVNPAQIFNINGRWAWVDSEGVAPYDPQAIKALKDEMKTNVYGDSELIEIVNTPVAIYLSL